MHAFPPHFFSANLHYNGPCQPLAHMNLPFGMPVFHGMMGLPAMDNPRLMAFTMCFPKKKSCSYCGAKQGSYQSPSYP